MHDVHSNAEKEQRKVYEIGRSMSNAALHNHQLRRDDWMFHALPLQNAELHLKEKNGWCSLDWTALAIAHDGGRRRGAAGGRAPRNVIQSH